MKRELSIISFLLIALHVLAGPVSSRDALEKARKFLIMRGIESSGLKERMRASVRSAAKDTENAAYYVFNVGNNGGFVVVSGDDRTDAVLGYSLCGDFDESMMPENMRAWLQGYAGQISSMDADRQALGYDPKDMGHVGQTKLYAPLTASVDIHDAIEPIIKTKWHQGKPYNAMCPDDANGKKTYTGCVATAMAQIMNHYKYPASFPAIDAYTIPESKLEVPRLEGVESFDWSSLKNEYSEDESDDAIATLMRYCGQSVQMKYSSVGSGASCYFAKLAMLTTFGYKSADHISRQEYSARGWDELIYNELSNNHPLLLDGGSISDGHAFVCDGYDGYGYYHINWGWGGEADGYFLLSALNFNGDGIGENSSLEGFNMTQYVITNLRVDEPAPTAIKTVMNGDITYDEEKNALKVFYQNVTDSVYDFDLGFGYMDDMQNVVNVTTVKNIKALPSYATETVYVPLSLFSTLPDGMYRMVPTSKLTGSDEWYNCYYNEDCFVEMSVAGGVPAYVASHPDYSLSIEMHPVMDTVYANSPNKISATITNNGKDMVRKITLLKCEPAGEGQQFESTTAEGDFMPGESKDLIFVIIPPKAGEYILSLQDWYYGKQLCEPISVTAVALPKEELKVTISNPHFVGGKSVRLEVDITNNDSFQHPGRKAKPTFHVKNKENELTIDDMTFDVDAIRPGETVTAYYLLGRKMHTDWTEFSVSDTLLMQKPTEAGEEWTSHMMTTASQRFYLAQMSGFGCSAYSKPEALDFTGCDDLIAYTGKVNAEMDALVMTPHEQMPAGTGMMLKGTPQARYAIKVAAGTVPPVEDNDLEAARCDTPTAANSVLVLGCDNGNIGMYAFTGTAITAGHSYLPKAKAGDASYMDILWDGKPSSIRDAAIEYKASHADIFNLSGQRVNENYRGIVIKNGKKYMMGQQ